MNKWVAVVFEQAGQYYFNAFPKLVVFILQWVHFPPERHLVLQAVLNLPNNNDIN